MISSANIQRKIVDYLSDHEHHSVQEIKTHLQQSGMTDYTEGQFAGSVNTLLRNGTIKKIDRGIYALTARSEDMKKCFVVSPIGDEGSDIRNNADKLFKYVIKPVCEECDLNPIRVDQINDANSITQTIIDSLDSADLVIADMTGHNPNVFYEMGYRKCTNKPIIHLKKKGENIPFDVNTIRTYEYDLTDLDSVEEIKSRLKQTIESFTFEEIDTVEEQGNDQGTQFLPAILPMLYQILDSIEELKSEVSKKDTETIQAIMQTSLNNATREESTDAILMKTLLPELLKNPQAFTNLMKIAEMGNKAKKK